MTTRAALAALALLALLAGCGEDQQAGDQASPTAAGETNPGVTAADRETARMAETCRPAEADIVQAVEAILADGYSLGPAGVAEHPEGLVLIADIFEGAEKVSSGDTWLVDPPRALPLSSSAEDFSTIPRPDGAATIAGQIAALTSPPYAAACRPQ